MAEPSQDISPEQMQEIISGKEIVWQEPTETKPEEVVEDAETEEAPVEEEAPAEETETVEATPTEEAPVEAAPAEEVEEEVETPRERATRLELEQLKAKFDLQMEHNARLSGTIGNLKQQLKAPAKGDETEEIADVKSYIDSKFEELTHSSRSEAVATAVQSEILAFDALPETKQLSESEFFKPIAAKYVPEIKFAFERDDPQEARRFAAVVCRALIAEVKTEVDRAQDLKARQIKAEQKEKTLTSKKASAKPSSAAGGKATSADPKVDWSNPDSIAAYWRAKGRPGW
jgi:hypothetical protein